VRSSRHVFAACALSAGLLVPAISLAAQDDDPPAGAATATTLTPSNVRPDAALTSATQDGTVSFDASGSADSDGAIASYAWDLDGDSVYETDTGADPRVRHDYPGGTTLIAAVRVTDDAGASDDATTAVAVPAAPDATQAAAAPAADSAALVPTGDLAAADEPAAPAAPAPAAEPRATKRKREKTEPVTDTAESDPPARAAANGAVTIKDFSFAPATVTISAGDSVTWLNQGPTTHTATASDGSFDSGNLAKGKSYSKTFSSAGTFSYICKPHPFMKGKVVVTAAGSGSGSAGASGSGSDSGSSGSGDSAGTSSSGGDSSSGTLANTGADLIPWSLFGFSLLAFGAALRFRLTD
jgi:plastocyanin